MESPKQVILISEDELDAIVSRIAREIDTVYKDCEHLVLVCILKGAVMFMADLMKKLKTPAEIDFMKASSYADSTESSGTINIILDFARKDIKELDILIVEDIIDSGNTLKYLTALLSERGAKSVRTCTLLDKPSRRKVDFTPDFCGMQIPDEFVIGYGLDYGEKYRTLPHIAILEQN
jgi:hypoxanthine phosphoribosyltransferase